MSPSAALLLLSAALSVATAATKFGELETVHEWDRLDFDWPTAARRAAALADETFVPDNCVLFDVKAVDGEVFVTVPRLKHGVPSSVNRLLVRQNDTVLRPYPSWKINAAGECENIQNAYAIEIDTLRRMWIIDSGSRDTFTRPVNDCPPKLVVWDMVAEQEVRRFELPRELVLRNGAMLRGLVVEPAADDDEDWFAYIADTKGEQLLVYSWRENDAWNVTHATMKLDSDSLTVRVDGEPVTSLIGIDSLALTPRGAGEPRLFFSAVSSFTFFSVHTAFLRNRTEVALATGAALDAQITAVGTRSSQSEGMTTSDDGVMFYSVLNENAVNQWNTSRPFSAMDQVYKDDVRLQWPNSFGWDGGYLYVVSNRWHLSSVLGYDDNVDPIMFRLLRARVNMNGYMGPYPRGRRVGAVGAAQPRAANAAVIAAAALLCAAVVAAV